MKGVTVVGSGASGAHFALSLLERGHRVTLFDVGYTGSPPPLPGERVDGLRQRLEDPARYFLGDDFSGAILPDSEDEFYGIPPSKQFVFRRPEGFTTSQRGFAPLFSFARGGLAEAWTAGCYPFDEKDLLAFPFGLTDLMPAYGTVARRIGVTGEPDDLARFFPLHEGLLPPLDLDESSALLLDAYDRRREVLRGAGFHLGRTRVAVLSRDLGSRRACTYLGRCLWGCPTASLYTPTSTLEQCREHSNFVYRPGQRVDSFTYGDDGRVREVILARAGGAATREPVETLALAAGTLESSAIVLRSLSASGGDPPRLTGLMDNPQVLVPFVHLRMVGRRHREDTYQYHLLGLGLEAPEVGGYVHGQITTLKTGMIHPVAQSLPFDLATSLAVTRNLRAALGMVNLNFADSRRPANTLSLDREAGGADRLHIEYPEKPHSPATMRRAVQRTVRALRRLGCVVPPGMIHQRPMGASVHYAGTLPMSTKPGSWTTDETCRSRDFGNLFLLDGSTFPALPAKNITFTLMANAVRVAEAAF